MALDAETAPARADELTLAALGDQRRERLENLAGLSARTAPHVRAPAPIQTADPALAALAEAFVERLEPRFLAPEEREHRAIPDGELLVFQVKIGRYTIDAPVTGVKRGRGAMVPVGEFARSLYLAIEVDPEIGAAEGWAFAEDHRVTADARTGRLRAGDREWTAPAGDIVEEAGDILLHTDTLAEWLDLEIDIDFRFLVMRVKTERPLPIITQLERRKRAANRATRAAPEPVLPPLDDPYALASTPTLDAQATYAYRDIEDGASSSTLSHSVLASGDVARMSGLLFLSGDTDDAARVRRLTLSRTSPEAGLAGPAHATRVELGDVTAVDLPFAPGAPLQRGARITNAPIGSAGAFGATDVTGDVQPGWDVELYRNGVLVGLQTVAADGRYSFLDVPLFAGANQFRIVSYGPQGQVREETRTLSADPGGVGERVVYDVSLAEQGRALLGGESELDAERPQGLRATARARIQVGPQWGADAGYDTPILEDGRHHQVIAGVSGAARANVIRAAVRADLSGGAASEATLTRPVLGQQARVRHAVYSDYPTGDGASSLDGSRTDVSFAGAVAPGGGTRVSYQLEAEREDLADVQRDRVEGRLSRRVGPADMDAGLRWEDERGDDGGDSLFASLGASVNSRRVLTRARVTADAQEGELGDADVSVRYRFSPDLSANARVQNTFATDETVVEARGDWDLGRFEVGPRARWSSEGEWSALVDGRVSLGWDPLRSAPRFSSTRGSGAGAVSVRVFEDMNGDGAFDRGDMPVEGAEVNAVQARRHAVSDDRGLAYLERLPAHRRTDVQVEHSSLEDPYLAPLAPGVSIAPRPGRVQTLDIALVATSEVEGSVIVRTARGTTPVPGALVRAVDAQGAVRAEARTASDGFFVLAHLPVGTYRLLLERDVLDQRGWRPDRASFITVRRAREIVVRNISLAARDAPPADPLASAGLARVDGARLAAALSERTSRSGYALSLGAYDTKFGRDAALMMLLARFPEEMAGLGLVSPDASPLGDQLLAIGPLPSAEAAARLCARLGDLVSMCEANALSFHAADAADPARTVSAMRRSRPAGG